MWKQLCFKNYLSCIYFCKHVLIMYIHIQTMFICSQMFHLNLHFINHINFSWKINVFSLHHACVLFFYLMKCQELFLFQMSVALNVAQWQEDYPMDFYASDSLGPWTVNNVKHQPPRKQRPRKTVPIIAETPKTDSCSKSCTSCSCSQNTSIPEIKEKT